MNNNMRTYFLSAALLLFAFTSSLAQGFHIGVKGGVNMFNINDQAFKDGFQFGYNLGGFAEINFTKKWGLQPELLWSQNAYKTATDIQQVIPGSVSNLNVQLNYLQVPLLLSFRPSKLIAFQVGPQFGTLINKDKSIFNNTVGSFKSGDFSMLAGAQLNLGSLRLGGRYVIGLNELGDITTETSWKNRGWQLYAGLKIF